MADTPLVIDLKAGNRAQEFAPDITRENQLPGGVAPPPADIPPPPLVMAQATPPQVGSSPPTDAGVDYLVQRAQKDSDALLERARARFGVQPPAPSPSGATAAPAPVAAGFSPAAATVGEAAAPPVAPSPPAPGVPADTGDVSPSTMGGNIDPLKVAQNVGREIVRTPRAVAAGVATAGRELFQAADSLATWLNDNVVDLSLPATGVSWLDNPAKAIADAIPVPATPDTVTGPIVKEVAQFLAGMVGGGKLLKGAGVTLKGAKGGLASGAMADALFFDPNEDNLTAMLNKVPALEKVVPDFLATDPDDNEALNRLRRAVEGLGLGVATEGLLAALRAYRAQRAAVGGETATAKKAALDAQRQKYGELTSDDLVKLLGDPDPKAKLVTIGEKADVVARSVGDGEPAEGFVRLYHGGAKPDGGRWVSPDLDYAAAYAEKSGGKVWYVDVPRDSDWLTKAYDDAGTNMPAPIANSEAPAGVMVNAREVGGPDAAGMVAKADDLATRADVAAEPKPAAGNLPGGRIAINWARIETGDDIKVAMREMADHFKAEITAARRGTITQEETAALADQLGMTLPDLLARMEGQAFNAEQTLAARRMLTMASENLVEAARRAAAPNAGAVDLFAFRRMVATHAAIQNEVLAARAEAGRALAAWKIPATAAGDVERSRAIMEALSAAGGDSMARDLARRMGILAESGAPESAIAQVAQRGWGAATWDAVSEVWINGLLSSPKTHIVNVASNSLVLAQQIVERGIAEKLATLVREGGALPAGVAPGEAAAMMYGLIAAQKDAWKASWLALKSGETGGALGKVDVPNRRAVTAEAFRIENDAAAKTVDFLGTVARVPSRLLGAEDEFFKTIAYRMEVGAQAVRQATAEGLQGPELRARVADLVANPPETIRLQAADAALYATFTQNAGDAAQALLKLREAWPATMYVLPFVRTPINILAYGFERTPLAPLMSGFRDDMAAGGARAQLATVKMATGTSIMLMAADYADRGLITGQGPKEPGKREAMLRQGWQPYSLRVGDKWVSYDRADPYGLLFGFAADMAETVNRMEVDADKLDEFSELLAAGIGAIASTTVNKTYLRGLADLMWTLEDPNRKAFGYVGSTMGSFVPAGVAAMKSMSDPVLRENFKAWDYVRGRLPGLTEGMVPARDLWGVERRPASGMGMVYDTLAPMRASEMKVSPIDTEMQRLGLNVERIDKKTNVEGVAVNFRDFPEVYDRYVVLAGNELKHPAFGMGARDYLDALVTGRHPLSVAYNMSGNGPEGGKAVMIQGIILQYRKMAQAAILADPSFALFQAAWREQRDVQAERRARLEGQQQIKTPDIARPMPPGAQPVAPPAGISPMRAP